MTCLFRKVRFLTELLKAKIPIPARSKTPAPTVVIGLKSLGIKLF
jgi:hypothetical protein